MDLLGVIALADAFRELADRGGSVLLPLPSGEHDKNKRADQNAVGDRDP